MSASNILNYSESLEAAEDAHHTVVNGNLYLLFGTAASTLTGRHMEIVDAKVVPFLVRATRHFGSGQYDLHVYGAASASNRSGRNDDLAAARAYNAAMYAIRSFETIQAGDPSLAGVAIEPSVINVSDSFSTQEAAILRLKPHQVEKQQAAHRAAMFKFKAQFDHPKGSNVFQAREVHKFRMETVRRPLPDVIDELLRQWDELDFIGKFVVKEGISKLRKAAFLDPSLLPPQFRPLVWTFEYMVPVDLLHCFELRDYRGRVARYRFDGEGHSLSIGVAKLLGWMSALFKAIKVLQVLAKIDGWAENANKLLGYLKVTVDDIRAWLLRAAPGLAPVMDALAAGSEIVYADSLASGWQAFKFKDGSPDWDVTQQSGLAKCYRTILLGKDSVRLVFGRPKSRNDWTFPADVTIEKAWSLRNGLIGNESVTIGSMTLVQAQ